MRREPNRVAGKALALVIAVVATTSCTIPGKEMPADYPLPIYPGATIPKDAYREIGVVNAKSATLQLNENQDSQQVIDFYKTQLEKAGYGRFKLQKTQTGQAFTCIKFSGTNPKFCEGAKVDVRPGALILIYTKNEVK